MIKMKRFRILLIAMCILMLFTGCGRLVSITSTNSTSKTITAFDDVPALFKAWRPLSFTSGESYRYAFEIFTGEYYVNGKLEFSVSGKAPAGLRFAWKFTIGKETFKGGYFGENTKFFNKFGEFCSENPITAMVFEALVTPYEAASVYNIVVAKFDKFDVGVELETDHGGKKYYHKVESQSAFGGVDGYMISTSLDSVPQSVICISPYTAFPTYSLYFSDKEENSDFYIMCNLEAAILP